ncbi:DUF1672 family protein [Salipaludibacillus agaradhaerens]|uniref:DUF1672 domain-containing protein n=1 Tax=Salipaludibacillus agaradhaerens TaxID=76935 RepID=UPI002151F25E|nr:DUF1672 domain-containing protein [Salipaludibacillus agaradhaerens]MCR6108111.1 DUF1672 family protein [Salipaludibacillus agaradhaerens]MCR6120136.1 DUF1672 family protein [Salipaludibacillus agaradhaerens]
MKYLCLISFSVVFLLGGCVTMNDSNQLQDDQSEIEEVHDRYVNVTDYTGEGYDLPDGEATDPIANEKMTEIEKAVSTFFLEEYKTDVIVHNAVGNADGATVFVQSIGEPQFHTYAMIGIDIEKGDIKAENIWTETNQVEQAIFSGLLVMIMEEEFSELDTFISEIAATNPVVGLREEAINNVKATAYTTPYYFVQPLALRDEMAQMTNLYFDNPNISADELRQHFDKESYEAEKLIISISFFMEEKEPDPALFDNIVDSFKDVEGVPRANYTLSLHDNKINKQSASGDQNNSLEISDIIKRRGD